MHKTILFDCGKVLIGFSRKKLLNVYVGEDEESRDLINEAIFKDWGMQDKGMPTKDYYELAKSKLPECLHQSAYNILFHWKEQTWPLPGMMEIVQRLKENGHQLILLSNMPDTFSYDHDDVDVLKYFDDLVFSFVVGLAKPDPQIFVYTLNKFAIKPSDCLFVDDNPDNILSAESVGIDGYLFDPENTAKFIEFAEKNEL